MDILNFHKKLIDNYKTYIQSFLNIKDPKILNFVDDEIGNKKLWPEPLVQFNPTFETGKSFPSLIDEAHLNSKIDKIFPEYELYKHQEEAILLGASGKEFIVTSGTGSGKSLTYMAVIFNHVLNQGEQCNNKIQAVVVYPMNALINSQYKEIDKFKTKYESKYSEPFPITFAQYTGQESEEQKEKLRLNPPHILLTNYMMLELIMTRSGRDVEVRNNLLENVKYLVFDELHTYRGRKGSDVSILIRRIKSAANNRVSCIGTSATMISSDSSTLLEQKEKVAEVASTIFGTTIKSDQVVNEHLVRSIGLGKSPTSNELTKVIKNGISANSPEEFEKHPVANWLEEKIALDTKEERLVRRKPTTLLSIAEQLSDIAEVELETAIKHIQDLLEWANTLNTSSDKKKNYLPYRIHQFITQTGSVYATLGDQKTRSLFLDAGLYTENKETMLFPLVFSRSSGHELYCVNLSANESKIFPREFYDFIDEEEEMESDEGYIFIQHDEDEEAIWEVERDVPELPETWFNPERRDGTRRLKSERERRLPRKIYFDKQGNYSFEEEKEFQGWFISSPLLFDPTSGIIFDSQTAEWTKVMKLGGEGRSTATTVLSFETITQLQVFGESSEKQKLLSFTDNRQDASLQAGHFNDFVKVGQLRAAIAKALEKNQTLDFSNISDKVFESLNISQEQFAKQPATFPGPKKENEDAFKDFIMYRLLYDLRRSWRVVLPNLEQCGLLKIEYKHVKESVQNNSIWEKNELLFGMTPDEKIEFLQQVFDFFRKSYALSYSMLESGSISSNSKKINEKLKSPWTLDEKEKLELPFHIRLEKLSRSAINFYSVSGGMLSVFGRYIRNVASKHGIVIRGKEAFNEFTYNLLDFLSTTGGWLTKKPAKNENDDPIFVFQLKVDNILWCKGDGKSLTPDLIKNRSYKPSIQAPNKYFQGFYQTNFNSIKPIEGREHTGQINNEKRKLREEEFREGKIGALFCSPTMELGIDISDLSIVHLRNVPPSPANYAQRSGRAGRSGQAALVLVYCSNFSAHDRHYFKNSAQMVVGTVTAPRIDLINQELLLSHLHASILTRRPLSSLNNSLGELVDKTDLETLPLKQEIIDTLQINEKEKALILVNYKKVIEDSYFLNELSARNPSWFNDSWIKRNINNYENSFNLSLDRWRKLYKAAQNQIKAATSIIENRIYADSHEKKKEAYKSLKHAERQRDLLLNETSDPRYSSSKNKDQSEFYPYRYLAAEGFLPGYNFTRLPIRSFMESEDSGGEFISRPRFLALREFGPRNTIYHDGAKYRVDRMILTDAELKLENGKICPKTGYFLYDKQYGYEVDPIINETLQLDTKKHVHTTLIQMAETRAYELQRINCQEEERTKRGYDIQTYFSVDDGFENTIEGIVSIADDKLLHIHYLPTCRIFKLNLKWRASREHGFTINLNTGYWQSKKQKEENNEKDEIKDIKLFTSDTANALYIQPIKSLGLKGDGAGVITLMFAIKSAIENYFQVESNEIGATIMGEDSAPNILIFEASEGSLGVLSQIVDNPSLYKAIMNEAYKVCFYKNGIEETGDVLPATYDDLLSYYNQFYHQQIDRNYIRDALKNLKESKIEIISNKSFSSYDEHYAFMQASRDPNSSTEDQFLKYLYKNKLKLPDAAQPKVPAMYVCPDFYYKPNVYIFCDGTPHDDANVKKDDFEKRTSLKNAGYQVLSWYCKDPLEEFINRRPDLFKKVK